MTTMTTVQSHASPPAEPIYVTAPDMKRLMALVEGRRLTGTAETQSRPNGIRDFF